MDNPVSKKKIQEAEEEARKEIAEFIKMSRSADHALKLVKQEVGYIEDELGKRSIPYGGGFRGGKVKGTTYRRKVPQYYFGIPADILEAKRAIFKAFIEELEEKLAIGPKTRREAIIMFDRGHTLEELREMCRKKGLVVSGSKKQLIARLV